MTRFYDGDYYEDYPNAGALWWANAERALAGRRGRQALAELEQALLGLPAPRLISGRLANNAGDMCAVGALAAYKRVAAGEDRAGVVADMERLYPARCCCGHDESDHRDDGCSAVSRWSGNQCYCVEYEDDAEADGGDATAREGVRVGLTYALAWRLAYLNDEGVGSVSPEQRYEQVLAWVRKQLAGGVAA